VIPEIRKLASKKYSKINPLKPNQEKIVKKMDKIQEIGIEFTKLHKTYLFKISLDFLYPLIPIRTQSDSLLVFFILVENRCI